MVTYKFVDASANFSFPGPVTATADITGTFVLDSTTQTITSVDINLSGLPSFLTGWNSNYATVGNSFWTSTPNQFIATNASGDQLRLSFDHSGNHYPFYLYAGATDLADTQQFGAVFATSVTGAVRKAGHDPSAVPAAGTIGVSADAFHFAPDLGSGTNANANLHSDPVVTNAQAADLAALVTDPHLSLANAVMAYDGHETTHWDQVMQSHLHAAIVHH
jgi:hypothetical protein